MASGAAATPPTRRLSCGVVVVREGHAEPQFLLLRAYRYWDFPKGMVETGEAPIATARREVREETGLDDLDFRWGEAYRETERYAGGKTARYYVAQSTAGAVVLPVSPELGRPEHHEYRWCRYADGRKLLGDRVRAILQWAHELIGARKAPG